MLDIDQDLTPADLLPDIERMWEVSARCLDGLEREWNPADGSPVFTVNGKYTAQGWTEWTQGFQFGSSILQFDGTGEERFLESGRQNTVRYMAPHVTHVGVHDHGFNNVSTYGNLRRLMLEGRIPHDQKELDFYELALKASGAVQENHGPRRRSRWQPGPRPSWPGRQCALPITANAARVLSNSIRGPPAGFACPRHSTPT